MLLSTVLDALDAARTSENERDEVFTACLAGASPKDGPLAAVLLSGTLPGGPLWTAAPIPGPPSPSATLTLQQLDEAFVSIRSAPQDGAFERLLQRATVREVEFLCEHRDVRPEEAQASAVLRAVARALHLDPELLSDARDALGHFERTVQIAYASGADGLRSAMGQSPEPLEPHRHPELEAAILAAPDDATPLAVYADWLIEQGQLHGELIAAASAAERTGKRRRTWLPHLQRLLGARFPGVPLREVLLDERHATWRSGLLRELRFSPNLAAPAWAALLRSTLCFRLEALDVTLAPDFGPASIPALPALRQLNLRIGSWTRDADLSSLARCPKLAHLRLEGGPLPPKMAALQGLDALPALTRLDLGRGFALGAIPHLRYLDTLVAMHHSRAELAPIARSASLETLVLGSWPLADLQQLLSLLETLPRLRVLARDYPTLRLHNYARTRGLEVVDPTPYLPHARRVVP